MKSKPRGHAFTLNSKNDLYFAVVSMAVVLALMPELAFPQSKSQTNVSTVDLIIWGYILVSGLFGLVIVRPPLMKWYRSQIFFIRGKGPVDILLKQVFYRAGFELFTEATTK